jgi:hypothetical protein
VALSRSVRVYLVGAGAVLVPFLAFVVLGWPGDTDSCTCAVPDTCYCEGFSPAGAQSHDGGVRQPANTWSNLYALITALIVALRLQADRRSGPGSPLIRSTSLVPDLYVFIVLFLGLGSMWFHASLKGWAGNVDGLSMYAFAGFLVWFTALRLGLPRVVFWIAYPATAIAFTALGAAWDWRYASATLIGLLVAAYLGLEVMVWNRRHSVLLGRLLPRALWAGAVACIVAATVFWKLSQTGGPLCDADSLLQPHGLLWHPLAGVMAVLLYFYWREDTDSRSAR